MGLSLRKLLRRLNRDESGQSLIVVVTTMTVLLGLAGAGIDTATWMVRHHQAQVVADSAALAAAQCLASPGQKSTMFVGGTQTNVPVCSSSADTTDAQLVAVAYAAANGLTISTSNVTVSGNVVTVRATETSPGFFARLFGINQTTQSAAAGASWKPGSGQCQTAGQNCDFMFANSTNCSSGSNVLIVSTQGASTINGNIQTNGGLSASATGNAGGINGTGTSGPGCTPVSGGNHNPWNTAQPTQATSIISWPIDYSKDFPACSGSACTGPACTGGVSVCNGATNYPGWCNHVAQSDTFGGATGGQPVPGFVYCDTGVGASVNIDDPSTWTGKITFTSNGNNTYDDTFVAGQISYTAAGGDTISACGWTSSGFSQSTCSGTGNQPVPAPAGKTANYPVFYVTGGDPNPTNCAAGTSVSTSCAFSMVSNGNLLLNGDTFVPNGTAELNIQGNQALANTFIEANAIGAQLYGNFNGDGPSITGGGGPVANGGILLVQ